MVLTAAQQQIKDILGNEFEKIKLLSNLYDLVGSKERFIHICIERMKLSVNDAKKLFESVEIYRKHFKSTEK